MRRCPEDLTGTSANPSAGILNSKIGSVLNWQPSFVDVQRICGAAPSKMKRVFAPYASPFGQISDSVTVSVPSFRWKTLFVA